ncbi:MAG: glycoside hydrolase family 3 N-terminal domain-containing protein [Candidatus Paceibacterota bacterium]
MIILLLLLPKALIHNDNNSIDKQPISFKDALGSNFVIGFLGQTLDEETIKTIKYIKPSGIILYSRNCDTKDQLKKLIDQLQSVAKEIGDNKFFIMIDEEPGGATRINAFSDVFNSGEPNWLLMDDRLKEMGNYGINVDLAPLADYPFSEDSYIKNRIVAKDENTLIAFNKKFIETAKKNNISTTLKHFPGAGLFVQDPHTDISDSLADVNTFNRSLAIFEEGIKDGADFVMINHGIYENIDDKMATFSKKIVNDILIKQLGFSGLVITDDMADMPLQFEGDVNQEDFLFEALNAGNNMVLLSHRTEITREVFDRLLNKYSNNEDFHKIVINNYKKINDFKKNKNLVFN